MITADKIRVAVLFGGRSGEHEVSLSSATNVIRHLDRSRFEVVPIGIDKQGSWFLSDDVFKKGLATETPAKLSLQRDLGRMLFNPDLIGKDLAKVSPSSFLAKEATKNVGRLFDVVFPVIHGTLCEDGTVQGLLELADLPYVGCGVLASAIGMDKDITKRLAREAGFPVPLSLTIKQNRWIHHEKQFCEAVIQQFRFPVFVKSANSGSSVGVTKVKKPEDLQAVIEDTFHYDSKVIVEQAINAIEVEIAVLESLESDKDPIVSVAGEVRPSTKYEFYSYAAKLDPHGEELLIPAPIAADVQEKIRHMAKEIFFALDCEGMARVDFLLDRDTNAIYFNEINTIPGFTNTSMYPKLIEASGMSYSELLTHLVLLAMNRHERKAKLNLT